MQRIKRIALVILSSVLVLFAFAFVGCKKNKTNTATQPQQGTETYASKGYLTLDAYSITLYANETYPLQVKKYDENGTEKAIDKIEYTSEASKIVSVENGVLTANKAGTTYVQIKADGLQIACFVNVQEGNRESGFSIRFVEDCLYNGIPAQAFVYVSENGEKTRFDGKVSWSVEEDDVLSVSENGVVLPLAMSESSKLTATFTYDGKEYTIETDIVVQEPYAYTMSSPTVKLADLKTLSGKDNTLYTQAELAVWKINPITGETEMLSKDEFEISVMDEQVVSATIENDGKVAFQAKACGNTIAKATINGTPRSASVSVEVAIPVQEIADMDILSLASNNDSTLLSKSYMLVNDIDYEGKLIYPIATWTENNSRTVGVQWKYLLQTTEEKVKVGSVEFPKYEYVDRANVGKKAAGQEHCYGLTDEEFKYLAYNKGINSENKAFTGVFDGNGYAIKNAVTMNGSLLVAPTTGDWYSANSYIFGLTNGATIKNIAFENITMQAFSDFKPEDSDYGLNRRFVKGSSSDTSQIADGGVANNFRGFGVISRSMNSTIKNVYLDVNAESTTKMGYMLINGVLQIYATDSMTSNCVVSVRGETRANTRALGGAGSMNGGMFVNNIAIGVTHMETNLNDGQQGQSGNYWCKAESFATLLDTYESEVGESAVHPKSLSDVLASFEESIWDMTGLSNNAPKLKQGCSVLG